MYERSRKRQNRRGGHNRGACPRTAREPPTDTAPTPEKRRVKKPLIIGLAVVAIAAAAILVITVFSPQAKADKLYEQGSYAEALEAYEQVRSDNNAAKMSDCRYQLFLGYLLSDGTYKTSQGEVTWTVEGYSNEDIKCSLSGNVAEKSYVGFDEQWSITIHKGDTSADYSASCKAKILGKTINETGSGKLDLPSYTYGKEITFDDYENTGTVTGTTLIKKNSSTVAKMIQKGLIGALQESGTDATLADLGFTSL